MNTKRKISLILISIMILTALVSCDKMAMPDESIEEEKRYNVRVIEAVESELTAYLELSGDVEAKGSVDVYPEVVGKLTELSVEVGDYITKGSIMARVDSSKPGMAFAASPVLAPISGTVIAVNADLGATVTQQLPLFKVGQLTELEIFSQVPERFIDLAYEGQPCLITSSGTNRTEYNAIVSTVSPVVNPASRTMEIVCTLTESNPIKAGMFVGVKLITATQENIIVIPEDAIIRRSGDVYVFVSDGDKSIKTIITEGISSDGLVEITSGLNAGDIVITAGKSLLSDGSLIRLIEE